VQHITTLASHIHVFSHASELLSRLDTVCLVAQQVAPLIFAEEQHTLHLPSLVYSSSFPSAALNAHTRWIYHSGCLCHYDNAKHIRQQQAAAQNNGHNHCITVQYTVPAKPPSSMSQQKVQPIAYAAQRCPVRSFSHICQAIRSSHIQSEGVQQMP
jgi:hypothetical protein